MGPLLIDLIQKLSAQLLLIVLAFVITALNRIACNGISTLSANFINLVESLVFSGFLLSVVHLLTFSVMACNLLLARDTFLNFLEMCVLILHEWRHGIVEVFDYFLPVIELSHSPGILSVEVFGLGLEENVFKLFLVDSRYLLSVRYLIG